MFPTLRSNLATLYETRAVHSTRGARSDCHWYSAKPIFAMSFSCPVAGCALVSWSWCFALRMNPELTSTFYAIFTDCRMAHLLTRTTALADVRPISQLHVQLPSMLIMSKSYNLHSTIYQQYHAPTQSHIEGPASPASPPNSIAQRSSSSRAATAAHGPISSSVRSDLHSPCGAHFYSRWPHP